MQITLNTEELTEQDRSILAFIAGGSEAAPAAAAKAAPAKAAPAKAAKPAAAKAEEPADESADGPALSDAVDAATKLVSQGKAAVVKAALESVGAKRVSELAEGDIQAFLDALDA